MNTELHRIMKSTKLAYHHEVRKCKRNEEAILKDKVLNFCINGSSDVFEEIKAIRRHTTPQVNSMDGVEKANIPNHFRDVYSELYNRHEEETCNVHLQGLRTLPRICQVRP